jgi:predicted O-methyltransferase YrrM
MRLYSEYIEELEGRDLFEPSLWRKIPHGATAEQAAQRGAWVRALAACSCEFLCHLFDLRTFPTILEIGRAAGHTLGLFRFMSPMSQVVSVEIKPQRTAETIARCWDPELARTVLIDKASDDAFGDGDVQKYAPYQFVLIDGLHSSEQVAADWENVLGVVAADGIVMFDDLQAPGPYSVFAEIKRPKLYLHSHGRVPHGNKGRAGVVFLGERPTGVRRESACEWEPKGVRPGEAHATL